MHQQGTALGASSEAHGAGAMKVEGRRSGDEGKLSTVFKASDAFRPMKASFRLQWLEHKAVPQVKVTTNRNCPSARVFFFARAPPGTAARGLSGRGRKTRPASVTVRFFNEFKTKLRQDFVGGNCDSMRKSELKK